MENRVVSHYNTLRIAYRFSDGMAEGDFHTFFDWLGEHDIVTAYELSGDFVCYQGDVYEFGEDRMMEIIRLGQTTLKRIAPLENYVHTVSPTLANKDFLSWYYSG